MASITRALVLIFFLQGCGDSPFLKTSDEESQNVRTSLQALESGQLQMKEVGLSIHPYWQQGPFVSEESSMLVVLTDNEGRPTDPSGEFNIMLWMPTMGHGSFPVSIERVEKGVYLIKELFFIMEGYWDIHFQILENSQVVSEVKWGLTL